MTRRHGPITRLHAAENWSGISLARPPSGAYGERRAFNQDSSLAIAKGWDDVTGVGSPTADWVTSVG